MTIPDYQSLMLSVLRIAEAAARAEEQIDDLQSVQHAALGASCAAKTPTWSNEGQSPACGGLVSQTASSP
jgi:hypothetical protein